MRVVRWRWREEVGNRWCREGEGVYEVEGGSKEVDR